jgi:hypothetical protein
MGTFPTFVRTNPGSERLSLLGQFWLIKQTLPGFCGFRQMFTHLLFRLTNATSFYGLKNLAVIFIRATPTAIIRKVYESPLSGHLIEGLYNAKQNIVFGGNKDSEVKGLIFPFNGLLLSNAFLGVR